MCLGVELSACAAQVFQNEVQIRRNGTWKRLLVTVADFQKHSDTLKMLYCECKFPRYLFARARFIRQ
jgi:hypothetical protein